MACSTCAARARLREPEKHTPEELAEAERVLIAAAQTAPFDGKSLADLYREAVETPSDINQHCHKLKELASECEHVTDIGMRTASSIALVAGQPKKLVRVSGTKDAYTHAFVTDKYVAEHTEVVWSKGLTPAWDMKEETDLLFLDTQHNANQIYLELAKYAGKVRRYIVRHDTDVFGENGDGPPGTPGLKVGIRQFLRENPEWSVIYETTDQYGLMVLGRLDKDKKQLPSIGRQAFNFTKHLIREAIEEGGLVPDDVFHARLDKCLTCIHRVNDRCSVCGCFLDHNTKLNKPGKAAYANEECPLPEPEKRWGKHVTE